jgi:hypothetical protein
MGFTQAFRQSTSKAGWLRSLALVPAYLTYRVRCKRWYPRYYELERSEGFDTQFGTDTTQIVEGFELDTDHIVYRYEAVAASAIQTILAGLLIRYEDYVFIDIGSGKGRSCLLASHFPFRQIIGVEISHRLTQIANENFAKYRPTDQKVRNFTPVCADALMYELPDTNLVLYMANPFAYKALAKFVKGLERSLSMTPRSAIVLYVFPMFPKAFAESDMLQLTRTMDGFPPWHLYKYCCAAQKPGFEGR